MAKNGGIRRSITLTKEQEEKIVSAAQNSGIQEQEIFRAIVRAGFDSYFNKDNSAELLACIAEDIEIIKSTTKAALILDVFLNPDLHPRGEIFRSALASAKNTDDSEQNPLRGVYFAARDGHNLDWLMGKPRKEWFLDLGRALGEVE